MAETETLKCPRCGEPVWDGPMGHKLAKCWGCGLAFDTMDDDEGEDMNAETTIRPIVSHRCVGCDTFHAESALKAVKVSDETFYACDTCAAAYDGPGRGEGIAEDDRALAVVLEHLASISAEDHFLTDQGGEYVGVFGQHVLSVDSQGFVGVRTFRDQESAMQEVNSWEDDGFGADEEDAYINYSRGGLEVSFAGKRVGTFETLSRAMASVSVQMRKEGYFPNVWLTGEHGPTIRRINVW